MTKTDAQLAPPFKILKVVDTREFVEDGDRWVAVPGSGNVQECARCGRPHEIHAHVEDSRGAEAVVGVGCMQVERSEVRRLCGKATRAAKKAAQVAATAAASAELDRHVAAAEALEFPVHRRTSGQNDSGTVTWTVDTTTVWVNKWADHDERMRYLEDAWRRDQVIELSGGVDRYWELRRTARR